MATEELRSRADRRMLRDAVTRLSQRDKTGEICLSLGSRSRANNLELSLGIDALERAEAIDAVFHRRRYCRT